MTQAIRDTLRDMLGPDVGIGITDPRVPLEPLWTVERPAMARAIPARVKEFTAGRQAARAAMADLGVHPTAVPMRDSRAPHWPAGLTGSITHTDDLCVAVVSQSHQGIGVDVEPATPLDPDLWNTVCTADELAWVQTQPEPGVAAKMIFCAKEAVYKAQYPLTGRMLDFQEVSILPLLEPDFRSFAATIGPIRGQGNVTSTQDWIVCAISLAAAGISE